ncbi:MAG: aminodeoxychorismate lyase [Pseudomonadota bacterium]
MTLGTGSDLLASFVDGRPSQVVDVEDRGLAYGHGVFETFRVHKGDIIDLSLHLKRLRSGASCLRLPVVPLHSIETELTQIATEHQNCIVKLICTNGSGPRGYKPVPDTIRRLVYVYPLPSFPDQYYESGVNVTVCNTRLGVSPVAGTKHLNRLEQVLARGELSEKDQEGLMLDQHHRVIEGTMSNVFCVRHGMLVTSALDQCGVAGVKRERVIAWARELNVKVDFASVSLGELWECEEIFLTNSVIGIWPVAKVTSPGAVIGETVGKRWTRIGEMTKRFSEVINFWRD